MPPPLLRYRLHNEALAFSSSTPSTSLLHSSDEAVPAPPSTLMTPDTSPSAISTTGTPIQNSKRLRCYQPQVIDTRVHILTRRGNSTTHHCSPVLLLCVLDNHPSKQRHPKVCFHALPRARAQLGVMESMPRTSSLRCCSVAASPWARCASGFMLAIRMRMQPA
jgi:hypothetical protein